MDNDNPAVVSEAPEATAIVEDKVEEQPSPADVQVNNEAPEAAQEVKEPVAEATDKADEKLYAGTFKSPDDLERAYQELRSKSTKDSQEKAELAKILNDAFLVPEPQAQAQAPDTDYYDEGESNPVNQELASIKTRLAISEFLTNHQDADAQSLVEVINSDSNVASITSPEAKLEYAYLKSQSMGSKKAIVEAEKKSAEQAQVKFAEKQAAQVETVKQQAQPVDDDKELSPSELRDTLKNTKAFDDLISKKFPGISNMKTRR